MLHTVLCRLFTPVQTVLIVLALMNSRQESEKSIKMVWQPFLFQRNYGYRYVTRNHHPQNNLRVSYPGYVVSMIYIYANNLTRERTVVYQLFLLAVSIATNSLVSITATKMLLTPTRRVGVNIGQKSAIATNSSSD